MYYTWVRVHLPTLEHVHLEEQVGHVQDILEVHNKTYLEETTEYSTVEIEYVE